MAWHKTLVEAAAEHDETLMEKFFESESLTEDEMREGIRKGLAARGMFPVFCVCAGKDMGVRRLMEFLGNVVPFVDEMPVVHNTRGVPVPPVLMLLLLYISLRRQLNPISAMCSTLKL